METLKPKIQFYRQRSFGQKLSAVFDFLRENWKPLIKYSTIIILPLCLIQALSLNSLMNYTSRVMLENMDGHPADPTTFLFSYLAQYGMYILIFSIGSILITSVVYGIMRKYNESEAGIQDITFAQLRPFFMRNLGRITIAFLFVIALVVVFYILMILLAILHPLTLFLTVPALFAGLIPMGMFMPVYAFEEIGVIEALTKTLRLGFATWGGVFGVAFVIGLIASVVQFVFAIPWYVMFVIQQVLTLSEQGVAGGGGGSSFAMYVLGIFQAYGLYISMILIHLGMAYQYAHASEKIDNTSINSDIENFEQL